MLTKLRLLNDRVLVSKVAAGQQTSAGVYLPQSAAQTLQTGVVLITGDKMKYPVSLGQRVVVPEFGGVRINLDKKEYFVYESGDLLGVLNE
jgi:chaperonin GroES